ncbi:hypothetical protein FNV43_RR21049 [Rhamnella rubrinervis]|uniref:Endoplasmic reticulum transmembrane protein n=1 Tax=Rhamnella rubrinervis TaxID=2594499 RepID=A0A8K0DVI1_9ROSA|nr:hypothetical protein FNV43_RR21049 [Rhamnella rubrinervis]
MALQWMILTYVVAVEAAIAFLLTLPYPKLLRNRFVSLVSLILQPALFIVPFAGFQLLDIYWKNEHRLMCTSDICTAAERDRYEKSTYKAQRNVILCAAACLLYWYVGKMSTSPLMETILQACVFTICKYHKQIESMEEVEKRYKNQ